MRSLKFRAWRLDVGKIDEKTKEFTPEPQYFFGEDVILDGEGRLLSVEGGWDIQGVEEPEAYALEQYTGLKDKNGKERVENHRKKRIKKLKAEIKSLKCFMRGI